MGKRWQLQRAGLVNFWYYHDEAEFHLSEGRLILRGTNGSGKSVTMQSFLPLVLDGDKRPWRLDPFGSRDRKIEYYLLLDENSGITDRTGYLYLEFYHPELERYLTVGIGLRARRNVPGVKFWGFTITDNRRVGKDILLYQRDYSQGAETKIPLTKNELEQVIGNGGEVVTEQGEYKKLVNKHLFGFSDLQAYQELLDLLIQLRSPKLSKDFKPSTIYEILTAALPALQEDELRPLSEVLEDMDQIGDHLEELAIHRKEAEKLDKAYNTYNEFLLYTESQRVLQEKNLKDQQGSRHRELVEGLEVLSGEIASKEEGLAGWQGELQGVKTELETLAKSEAVEKQAELDRLKKEEANTSVEIDSAHTRKTQWEERRDRAAREKELLATQLAGNLREQQDLISDMEAGARDCEFHHHDLYHRLWEKGIAGEDSAWSSWKRDLGDHEAKLEKALALAKEEAAQKLRVQEAEKDLSEARELRDQAEGELRRAEQDWEERQQEQQNLLFAWKKGLVRLPLSDEAFQEILHLLTKYPEISYEAVAGPAQAAFQQAGGKLMEERAGWEHRKKLHLDQEKELRTQWEEWKNHKEPEPPRSEAREGSRARRLASGEAGEPLYALCEFREGLSQEIKASLEAALAQAGLLDAWISSGRVEIDGPAEEEVWVEAQPELMAHTLADYLYPTPPENGSVSAEVIDQVLRTIRVGDVDGEGAITMVSEKGTFRLGAVAGQAPRKVRAEYIGKENRRLTRLAEMERLEGLIREEEAAVAQCDEKLRELALREQVLKEELEQFPKGDDLYRAYALVEGKQRAFDNAQQEEGRRHGRFKDIQALWSEVRNNLHRFMDGWSMPRTEAGIGNALASLRSYQGSYSDLKALWSTAFNLGRGKTTAEEDWAEACSRVEEETAYLEEKEGWLRDIRTQVKVFEKLLQELGIYDIHQRILELKERAGVLEGEIKKGDQELNQQKIALGIRQNEVENSREALEQREALFEAALGSWLKEWNRRLVSDIQEEALQTWDGKLNQAGNSYGQSGKRDGQQAEINQDDFTKAITDDEVMTALLRFIQRIRQQYKSKYEQRKVEDITNRLFAEFHNIRQSLHEYSPELVDDPESGRMLAVFMRDRQNPITPSHLLKELQAAEEEQRLLLSEKDRELYEQIIIHSVGRAIKQKIFRAEEWVRQMNRLMQQRQTSSGLRLWLKWEPRAARNEQELDTAQLVKLLKTDPNLLRDEQIEQMVNHFRSRISWAKRESEEHKETLRHWINQLLDYRQWFRFTLEYEKGDQTRRELTDARFNVLSGGEKAMAMYIPLFAATYSRYSDSREDCPKLISLDEAFAGVDDENMRDMFELLTQLDFDFMMTSQVLWGCYDTVPSLSVYEIYRPKDADFVTLIRYHWNGYQRRLVDELAEGVAATMEEPDDEPQ